MDLLKAFLSIIVAFLPMYLINRLIKYWEKRAHERKMQALKIEWENKRMLQRQQEIEAESKKKKTLIPERETAVLLKNKLELELKNRKKQEEAATKQRIKQKEEKAKAEEQQKIFQEQERQKYEFEIWIKNNYKPNWLEFQEVFEQQGIKHFYHFTDNSNIPAIKLHKGLYSWADAQRIGIEIPRPGGGDLSRSLDQRYGLQNYVRVSFTKSHPMLYIAKNDGRIIEPVLLEISLDVAYLNETRFSNMNATKTGHSQGKNIEDLKNIRFDLVKQPNHFDIQDDEKHFYQAEILVKQKIELKHITKIIKL